MLSFESTGRFSSTTQFLRTMSRSNIADILDAYGKEGVAALRSATPENTGLTADSWSYEVTQAKGYYTITWINTHAPDGIPVAILLQYGHGTGTGGYVQGKDYINPAIKPVFDNIANAVWKAVTSA